MIAVLLHEGKRSFKPRVVEEYETDGLTSTTGTDGRTKFKETAAVNLDQEPPPAFGKIFSPS